MENLKSEQHTIDKALELAGYGKYTILLTLACGFVMFGVNAEVYSVGFILPAAECDLDLDTGSKSMIAGACLAGMIVSSNFLGFLSDRKGRRKVIIFCGLATFICSSISALSYSFWPFIVFKFLGGVFIGGPASGVFAYLGEFLSSTYRSRSIILCGLIAGLALIYYSLLSWIVLPIQYTFYFFGYNFNIWRLYLLLNAAPIGLASLLVSVFPESPKFLLSNGEHDKSLQVLRTIHNGNKGTKYEYPVAQLSREEEQTQKTSSLYEVLFQQTVPLFAKGNLSKTSSVCLIQFGNYAISSGLLMWYTDILKEISKSNGDMSVCNALDEAWNNNATSSCHDDIDESIFRQNLFIGILYLIGYISIIIALKYIRKTYIIAFAHTISCLATLIVAFTTVPELIDVFFIILLVLPGISVPVVSAIVVDLFPTTIRATAISFTMTMGRLGSVVASSIVGYLLKWNCVATFGIFAATMLCWAAVAIALSSKDRPHERKERHK